MDASDGEDMVPIHEVARAFGVRASALRYYERRGLLEPAVQRAGRRWYSMAALRKLAAITFWQHSGSMSLDQIAELLDETTPPGAWKQVVAERSNALAHQIDEMRRARDFLEHLLICPREHFPDDCPYFEDDVWRPREERLRAAGTDGHVPARPPRH